MRRAEKKRIFLAKKQRHLPGGFNPLFEESGGRLGRVYLIMFNKEQYLGKFKIPQRNLNESQALAVEISEKFGGKISVGQILSFIGKWGQQAIRENAEQVDKIQGVKNRAGYFIGMCKRERGIFTTSPAKTR